MTPFGFMSRAIINNISIPKNIIFEETPEAYKDIERVLKDFIFHLNLKDNDKYI